MQYDLCSSREENLCEFEIGSGWCNFLFAISRILSMACTVYVCVCVCVSVDDWVAKLQSERVCPYLGQAFLARMQCDTVTILMPNTYSITHSAKIWYPYHFFSHFLSTVFFTFLFTTLVLLFPFSFIHISYSDAFFRYALQKMLDYYIIS